MQQATYNWCEVQPPLAVAMETHYCCYYIRILYSYTCINGNWKGIRVVKRNGNAGGG